MEEVDFIKKQEKQINKLVKQALKKSNPYSYIGVSFRDLQRYNAYKEEGLELTVDDINLTQIYAGLTVLSKQLYEDKFSDKSEIIKSTLHEAIEWDSKKYPVTAFPYNSEKFPYPNELKTINDIIAKRKMQPTPDLRFLDDHTIRHEWTVKVGKKLLMILMRKLEQIPVLIADESGGQKFKNFVCGKDGLNEKLNKGGSEADLVKTLASTMLSVIGFSATLTPLAVLASVILVKSYLKSYCMH